MLERVAVFWGLIAVVARAVCRDAQLTLLARDDPAIEVRTRASFSNLSRQQL